MKKFESNSLFVELTDAELKKYIKKFGEIYWNDSESIVCIPIGQLHREKSPDVLEYEKFFRIKSSKVEFLIFYLY